MSKLLYLMIILLLSATFAEAKLSFNGAITNDTLGTIHSSDSMSATAADRFSVIDILETKLIARAKTKNWNFYTDARVFLTYTSYAIPEPHTPELIDAKIMRAFMRLFTQFGDFTLGKTYINFGAAGIFNPFEFDKKINTTDLNYDKAGILALEYVLNIDDVFQIKAYAGMDQNEPDEPADYKGGLSLQGTAGTFDFGAVANRTGVDRNLFGAYFKGNIEVGINGAYAFHINDTFNTFFHEASAGIDYSFFRGKLIIALNYYFNSSGATDFSGYQTTSHNPDTYFSAQHYVYTNITGKIDEFTSVKLDLFTNMTDLSLLAAPSAVFIIKNGLTITAGIFIPIGGGDKEFSWKYNGYSTFLIRIEGKF